MAALDNIASELLKSANEADLNYKKTRDQAQRDKAVRLRRIVENLRQLVFGASDLNGLSDVTLSAPANGQVLTYNSTTTQWENQTPGGGGGGGDMYKSTYDVDNDGIVDGSETTQIIVRNSTGSTLLKGQVVYLSGATGNRPNAVLSQANTEATSSKTIGIVIANIANNSDGYIAVNGTLHNLDTSAFADGVAVWLSATTAGAYTSTIPAEPNHTVFIGYIARSHPTQGRLVILIQNGYELNELHGVLVTSEANNDLLVYETSSTLWKNKSISTIFGGTPLVSVPTLAQVTTAGNTTTNAITVGGLTVATNLIYTDTVNGRVGIGTLTPSAKVDIRSSGINTEVLHLVNSAGGTLMKVFNGGSGQSLVFIGSEILLRSDAALSYINAGNFAIGTTTDSGYKLDVVGTARVQGNVYLNDSVNRYIYGFNGTYIKLYDNLTGGLDIYNNGGFGATRNYGPLEVYGNFTTTGSFSMNGNLNIGNGNYLSADTSNYNKIYPYNGSNANMRFVVGHPTVGDFDWEYPLNTVLVRLKRNGNFLIGTTTDAGYKLDVNGTARVQGNLTLGDGTTLSNKDIILVSNRFVRLQDSGFNLTNWYGNSVVFRHTFGFNANSLFEMRYDSSFHVGLTGINQFSLSLRTTASESQVEGYRTAFNTNVKPLRLFTSDPFATASQTLSAGDIFIQTGTGVNGGNTGRIVFQIGNSTNNTAQFSTAGNFLINTTTDAGYKLDVNGTARVQGRLTMTGDYIQYGTNGNVAIGSTSNGSSFSNSASSLLYASANINNLAQFAHYFYTGTFNAISGNQGVISSTTATFSPTSGTSTFTGINLGFIINQTGGANGITRGLYINPTITAAADYRAIETTVGNVLLCTTSGNVAIGTSSPTDKLHIVDNTNGNKFARISAGGTDASAAWVAQNDQVDNVVYRVFGSAVSGTQMGISLARSASLLANLGGTGKFLVGTYSSTDFVMGTGNQERMRLVDSTGNFLVGTTTDLGNKLEVSGTINATAYKINNVIGYTGILNIPTNPPGMQNVDIQSGIVVNIF
jgi:hypothetical protein